MKKIIAILACSLTFVNAGLEDNFKKSIKNIADVEVEVEFKKELVSFPSMFFVIG